MSRLVKILVVEDDFVACRLLTEILEQSNYDVETANDGQRALQKLSEGSYDIVVTDLKMPKMNGLELLGEIKRTSRHTEVILISAFGDETVWIESLGLGAYDFIPKPFKKGEIVAVVGEALRHRDKRLTSGGAPTEGESGP